MAFTAQDVVTAAQQQVDAEASQRYLPDQDWLPAINAAYRRAIAACNFALANRKGSEEQLSELKVDLLFRTNGVGAIDIAKSRLATNALTVNGFKPWSIIAVYAEPQRYSLLPQVPLVAWPIPPNGSLSYYWTGDSSRPSLSNYPVQRVTAEELSVLANNQYMSGNETLALDRTGAPGKMRSYAYAIAGDQHSINDNVPGDTNDLTLLLRPIALSRNTWFWVTYLRAPEPLTTLTGLNTGTIHFPPSMLQMIVEWTLQYLSVPQGDGTSLYGTADKDAAQLFQLST